MGEIDRDRLDGIIADIEAVSQENGLEISDDKTLELALSFLIHKRIEEGRRPMQSTGFFKVENKTDEPATPNQIKYLRNAKVELDFATLTKREASKIIGEMEAKRGR